MKKLTGTCFLCLSWTYTIQHLEDVILHELAVSKGSILDNDDLIQTLQTTKAKAVEITLSLEEAKQTAEQIDKVNSFIPV